MTIMTTGGVERMSASVLEKDVAEVLIDEAAIQAKVKELGALISADYADRQVTLVSVAASVAEVSCSVNDASG